MRSHGRPEKQTIAIEQALGVKTMVWRLRLEAPETEPPEILVGRGYLAQVQAAWPACAADLIRAHQEGRSHCHIDAPSGHYSCQLHAEEMLPHSQARLVVITTWTPRGPATAPATAESTRPCKGVALPHEELAGLMEHAPAAIAVLRLKGGRLFYKAANRAYAALVGQVDPLGRTFGTLLQSEAKQEGGLHAFLLDVAKAGVRKELHSAAVTLDWHNNGSVFTKYLDVVLQPLPATSDEEAGVSVFAYDVTTQMQARREAESKKDYFRNLADSLPQVVWTSDHTGAIGWLNAQWYALTGRNPDDAGAKEFLSLIHPDEIEKVQARFGEALEHCVPFTCEMRLRIQDGTFRWFLVQVRPEIDPQTGLARWFGSSTDVHEQKISSQAVTDLLGNMTDGYMVIDGDWIIRHVNDRHVALTGLPKEAQLGRSMQDVFFSGQNQEASPYLQNCRRAKTDRVSIAFEEYYAPLDMWTAVNLYPTGDDGLAIIYSNLTAERLLRKNVEAERQKFEAVFFDSPAGMALLRGPDLVFEKANGSYIKFVGQRDIVGKPLLEAMPEMHGQPFAQLMTDVLNTGVPFEAHAMAAELLDGVTGIIRKLYFDFTYSRINDGAGNPYGVYIHAIDVTGKVEASKRADALAMRLTEAIEARDEFLSSASHELKTPVTSIKMQLQMTRRKVKPAEGIVPEASKLARVLDMCGKQVDRLAALIEDLLDVSRIAAGKMTFNYAPTDVSAMVRDVAEQFASAFEEAGCTVHVDAQSTTKLSCDAFRIEQVVVNLITNAIKYGAGSRVDVRVEERPGGGSCIEVADQGMGISEEGQKRVFERFERAVTHKNVSGLGLGLYICRQIVLGHGGDIEVSSVLGRGSKFTVKLPNMPPP